MPPMVDTTYVSNVDLSLVKDAQFSKWNYSLHRLLVPLLFRLNRDRSFNRQPEHMYWVPASVAFHPDGLG